MRRTMTGVNLELAAAVRRVNALLDRIAEDRHPDVFGESWRALEAELDCACGAGDREGTLAAIRHWERKTGRVLAAVEEQQQEVLTT